MTIGRRGPAAVDYTVSMLRWGLPDIILQKDKVYPELREYLSRDTIVVEGVKQLQRGNSWENGLSTG